MKSKFREWKPVAIALRQRAEDVIKEEDVVPDETLAWETRKLIHELRVHQVELELQNEELRLAQVELEVTKDRYQDLYDFAPVGYFTLGKNGVIQEVNLRGAAMLGMERGTLIGKKLSSFVCSEDQDILYRHSREVFETGKRQYCEVMVVKNDETTVPVRLESVVVHNNDGDDSSFRQYRTIMSDITEQVQLVRQIKKDKEEWRRTFDAIGDIVTIQDPHMRIIRINRVGCMTLKAEPEELVGKYCYEVFRGVSGPCSGCPATLITRDFTCHSTEIEHVRLGKTFHVSAAPIFDDQHNFIGIIHTAKDITEQKILEAQLRQAQKIEALGILAGGIAHDFNNILAAILGFADIAKEGVPKDSQLYDDLLQVIRAGIRAKDLVSQLLVFSRQNKTHKEPVPVHLIVKEVLKLLRASLPPNVEIRENVDTRADKIMADPTQIHQVLMNLCINAFHAMEKRGGILEVDVSEADLDAEKTALTLDLSPGQYLRLSIRDTGHGMDRAVMERIFEPFFTTKEAGKGTGMGLSVVYGIVKDHGGAITVHSEPGKGTTFHLFFPRINAFDDMKTTIETSLPPEGKERILVVDDEESLVKLAEQMLTHLGYDVVVATNSVRALELFRDQPEYFDLVITDQAMPIMTGIELTKKLLRLRPNLPIILCTGFSEALTLDKARSLGIREVIKKPFITGDIANVVRRAIDN